MNIREKHHSGNGYALLLHTQFENHLSQISDNEIDTRYQNFKKNILKQSKFYTIKNVIASSIDLK